MLIRVHKTIPVSIISFQYRPGTIVNFTGQVNRNYSDAADRLFNITIQTGSLPGNLTVDPGFLRSAQYKHGK